MKKDDSILKAWDSDLTTIIASKMDFVGDGGEFLYYRKGEALGSPEVAAYATQLIQLAAQNGLDVSTVFTNATQMLLTLAGGAAVAGATAAGLLKAWKFAIKQLEAFLDNADKTCEIIARIKRRLSGAPTEHKVNSDPRPIPRDIRILCNRTEENARVVPILHALGARIRYRPSHVDNSTHRFHVSQFRFVLNFKTPGRRYLGVAGTDPYLRDRLRSEFLNEWEMFGPDFTS